MTMMGPRITTFEDREAVVRALAPFVNRRYYATDATYHALVDSMPEVIAGMLDGWARRAADAERDHDRAYQEMLAAFPKVVVDPTLLPDEVRVIPRLSIPGNLCTFCGTEMGQPLVCSGCNHVDPPTIRPPETVADSRDS